MNEVTIENSSAETKDAIAEIAKVNHIWLPHQTVDLSVETDVIEFTGIPADARLVKIEGLLSAHNSGAGVITPAMTLNGITASIYQWTKYNHTGVAPTGSKSSSDVKVPFSSSWSGGEKVIFEAVIECDNDFTTRKAIKTHTSNTGGDGDFHTCGAFADIDDVISSIQIFDDFISANGFGINTKLYMSVMK